MDINQFKQMVQWSAQNSNAPQAQEFGKRVKAGNYNDVLTGAGYDPAKFGYVASSTQPLITPEQPKSVGGFLGNVVGSAGGLLGGMEKSVVHPVQTIKGLGQAAAGGIESIPGIKQFYDTHTTARGQQTLEQNRQAFNNIVNFYSKRYGGKNVQEVVKNIGNTAYTDPVGFALDLSILLSGGETAMGKIGELTKSEDIANLASKTGEFSETINPIGATLKTGEKAVETGKAINKLITPPLEEEKVIGKITQATKPYEIKAATDALKNVDLSGVKTYEQGLSRIKSQIAENSKAVDEIFSTNPKEYSINELTQKTATGKFGLNYVNQGLSDLKDLYSETKDINNAERIKTLIQKSKTEGLTAKEINDLSREYGEQFKAFKENSQIKAGKVAAGAENIRTGLKDTARSLLPTDESRILDLQTSHLIKTRDMFREMSDKVSQAQAKIQTPGTLGKTGQVAGRAVDVISGGIVKNFFRTLLQMGAKSGKTLNVVDIQNELAKNIAILDKINSLPSFQASLEFNKWINGLTKTYYAGKLSSEVNR